MSESNNRYKPIIIWGNEEGFEEFKKAVRDHAESLGWVLENAPEDSSCSEDKYLMADPYTSLEFKIIDFSDAPENKKLPPTIVVDLAQKKAELNQASTAREFPRINDMYQEQVLKPKNNE